MDPRIRAPSDEDQAAEIEREKAEMEGAEMRDVNSLLEPQFQAHNLAARKTEQQLEKEEQEGEEKLPFNLAEILFAHGDIPGNKSLPQTIRTLDSITTDYIIQICFGAGQHAALQNRAKIKLDDVLYALRKNPGALGKIEEMQDKMKTIANARKAVTDMDEDITTMAKNAGKDGEKDKGKGVEGKGRGKRKAPEELGSAFKKNLKGGRGKAFS